MAKAIEIADVEWFLKHVVSEDAVFIKTSEDVRLKTKSGFLTEKVEEVKPHPVKSYQGYILITLEVPNAPRGKKAIRFDLAKLIIEKTSFREVLSPLVMSTEEFCKAVNNIVKPGSNDQGEETKLEMPWTSLPSSGDVSQASKKKRVFAGGSKAADPVDLPSPSKQTKIKARDIDQKIDSHYIGHVTVSLDQLDDVCPEAWLDREINPEHVREIAEAIEKTPTIAKSMQSWIGIADISKKDLTSREMLRGCRVTVIGGRHRHAAYKKVYLVSKIHQKELEKVWIHLYDNELSDQEVRRLAAMHNIVNVGSMATPWMSRVHSCREWLYTSAGKNLEQDDTPPSTQAWKIACQEMYVAKDKDPNTLEPTLQAALLRKDVYKQFRSVGELYKIGELKDQGSAKSKKKKTKLKGDEIAQSKLGMPLQGLTDETKLALLKQVSMKEISINELKQKAQNIKKKQMVVNAFLKHTGEESYDTLTARFPLHATEEKLAQFVTSGISKKSTPQEVIAFFERALKWESERVSNTLNLHEEKDGVYFFQREDTNGILLEGSFSSIPLEKIRRLITLRPFKGFSLVLATLPKETSKKDLNLFFTTVHAANIDYLNDYSVALITDEEHVEICRQNLENRFTRHQLAYWVNTKPLKLQGHMLRNSIRPILFGHWAKDGVITDTHCHFGKDESANNTFCFQETEEELLPKSLTRHIVTHFSYEGQWILDLTDSRDSGLVAAISSGRNCVSLMKLHNLRKTAQATVNLVNQSEDEGEESSNDSDKDDE